VSAAEAAGIGVDRRVLRRAVAAGDSCAKAAWRGGNERQRQDRRRNAILLERKIPLFFSYEDVTIGPGCVANTVRGALAATARAAS
jgi:hypothetical protein